MKKYSNGIFYSGVGTLTFIFFLLPIISYYGNGFDFLFNTTGFGGFVYNLGALVFILSVITLIIFSILEILKTSGKIKTNVKKFLPVILYISAISSGVALLGNIIIAMSNGASLGAGLFLVTFVNISAIIAKIVINQEQQKEEIKNDELEEIKLLSQIDKLKASKNSTTEENNLEDAPQDTTQIEIKENNLEE